MSHTNVLLKKLDETVVPAGSTILITKKTQKALTEYYGSTSVKSRLNGKRMFYLNTWSTDTIKVHLRCAETTPKKLAKLNGWITR